MNIIKTRLSLIMGYLGAVVGAGFASGQEVMQFFVEYGTYGLKGAVLALLLFALCGGLLMYLAHLHTINNYQEMLKYLLGERFSSKLDLLLTVFLFLGVSMMMSASGSVFHEHLNSSKLLGIMLVYLLTVGLLYTGRNGLINAFNVLVPVKLILLLSITAYAAIVFHPQSEMASTILCPNASRFWALSAVLYVAYNFALAMVVLTEYQSVGDKGGGISGAVLGGVVLGILLGCTYFALIRFWPHILTYQVPMLFVAGQISIHTKIIYTLVLWVGILTTTIANAYGLAQRLSSYMKVSYHLSLIATVTLALPVSMLSFSDLVSKIYPLFGILGIIILVALLIKAFKYLCIEVLMNTSHK